MERVLVQYRLPKSGNPWAGLTFPRGHVESGESIAGSMVREFREETGLTICNLANCGYVQWYNPQMDTQYIIFCFKASGYSGQLTLSREGKMSWMMLPEMRAGGLAPKMERYLNVSCDERVVQTYGEASCWDDVIKHKADLHIIDDGTGRAARDGTGGLRLSRFARLFPEVGPYRCDTARAGARVLPVERVTRLRQPRPRVRQLPGDLLARGDPHEGLRGEGPQVSRRA